MEWIGFPTVSVDVKHAERYEGKSSYTFLKLLKLATETIIAYSDKPLWLSIKLGSAIASCSFIYGAYVIYSFFFHGVAVEGWTSLMVSIYFLGGVIMSILGMLGVYLGKVYDETKKRPLYIISKRVGL